MANSISLLVSTQAGTHGNGQSELSKEVLSLVDQNIQSRLRGLVMMTFSNASQSMLVTTTNKSEMAKYLRN